MAGQDHDFLLLSDEEYSSTDLLEWMDNPQAIQIHDDVLQYMLDTLNWITCYNPDLNMTKHNGLNLYGTTIIKSDGALCAEKVFAAWASMFSNGPKTIQLTGAYGWFGDDRETGSYMKLIVDRDEMVAKFTALANFAKRVVDSKNDLLILHLGI